MTAPLVLVLFDIDGTLTPARKTISPEMRAFMQTLRGKITVGVVGGSDFPKQKEQLGDSPNMFDWCFAENGLLAHRDGAVIGQTSFKDHLGEERLKKLINWILRYFADLDIPVKRGTFIEFRQGMLNVSPIGRNCSREERNDFEKFDLDTKERAEQAKHAIERRAFAARSPREESYVTVVSRLGRSARAGSRARQFRSCSDRRHTASSRFGEPLESGAVFRKGCQARLSSFISFKGCSKRRNALHLRWADILHTHLILRTEQAAYAGVELNGFNGTEQGATGSFIATVLAG